MARPRIATGIDIGTHHTKVVVVLDTLEKTSALPRILGTGLAETRGMRHGYVADAALVAESIREAARQAAGAAGMPIRKAFLAIGGISLGEARATGETIISRADQEITELDVAKVRAGAEEAARPHFANRTVLHRIPLEFRIDGTKVLGDPTGMQGTRLEGDYLFMLSLTKHVDALVHAVEDADIEIVDHMAAPLAGSYVLLSRDQKTKGCVLATIGAETTSAIVYDENTPLSLIVFPEGSDDITNDLALAFKISLEDAERLKLGKLGSAMYPRKKVDELITKRYEHIFTHLGKHLKTIGAEALPAGVILAGGGAGYGLVTDIAKRELALPARIAELHTPDHGKNRDATWAGAYGIALWGLTGDMENMPETLFSGVGTSLATFFGQFLP